MSIWNTVLSLKMHGLVFQYHPPQVHVSDYGTLPLLSQDSGTSSVKFYGYTFGKWMMKSLIMPYRLAQLSRQPMQDRSLISNCVKLRRHPLMGIKLC